MKRKTLLLGCAIIVVLVAGGSAGLYALLRHEPDFYEEAAVPPSPQREKDAADFQERAGNLAIQISESTDWHEEFTDQQVNSWFAEDFITSGLAKQLPPEITEPRVVFKPGKAMLAFRYGDSSINAIVSIEAKVWISRAEPNILVVEIEKLRAGALPLSQKALQEVLTDGARELNIDVQWYRNDRNTVALLRFQADKREPSFQLQALELRQGSVYLKGRSLDPDLRRSAETALGFKPTGVN